MSKEKRLSLAIQLADGAAKSMVKRALLCRTGEFDGMYGSVTVDKARLEAMLKKYQQVRAEPANENDYAPILLNHDRNVELVKGRLLPTNMSVEEWREIDGEMQFGLFGDLRVDNKEAQEAVDSGQYAHLSISYDEDSNEIFEVSFVAVEAARGSIVLSKSQGGTNMNLESKHQALAMRHKALASMVKQSRKGRTKALAALIEKRSAVQKEIEALTKRSSELAFTIKTAQLKTRFAEIIRAGKMNPVEFKKMDIKELSSLSEGQLKIVFASYENRPVSSDVFQYGQTTAEQKITTDLSHSEMRKAMKLQKAGKGAALEVGDDKDVDDKKLSDDEKEKKDLAEKEANEMKSYSMGKEEWDKCMEEMSGIHSKLAECVDKMKSMGQDEEKMASDEEDDKKKEEMAAEEEPNKEEK